MYFGKENILVLGAGVSGIAACRLALSCGHQVTLYDQNPKSISGEACRQLAAQGATLLSGAPEELKGSFDVAVFSPGIPVDSALGRHVATIAKNCMSELAYGASFLKAPLLAVTGTNGKTTTVEMLAHCLAAAGKKTVAAGNIGLPLSQIALAGEPMDVVVVEVSSFQLELSKDFRPWAAVLLNITPDHLVRHGTMENYTRIKLDIFKNIPEVSRCFTTPKLASLVPGCATFSADIGAKADFTPELLSGVEFPFTGRHNTENALAAMALASTVGVTPADCVKALQSFHTGDHRLQIVETAFGYTFIDDSKATNVDAVIQALETVSIRPLVLIAGGLDKGCSLKELLEPLKKNVYHVAVIGSCKRRLADEWDPVVTCTECNTMKEAVDEAIMALPEGGCVLLSPGCASQDMFRDYEERGDEFARCVRDWIKSV